MQPNHEALHRALVRRGRSPQTAKLYAGFVRRFDAWLIATGRPHARRCSIEDVQDYALTLVPTYSTRGAFQNAMRALWRQAGRDADPLDALPVPPRPDMICAALPDDALSVLVDRARQLGVREHAAVALMYCVGLRVSETAALPRVSDKGDELVVVGKGGRTRWLPIEPILRDALDGVPKVGSPWFFPSPKKAGRPVHAQTVRDWARLAGAGAELGRIKPHQLRHSCLATMNDELGDLRATAEYAGHSRNSLSVTMGYTRTRKARLRQCAQAVTSKLMPHIASG